MLEEREFQRTVKDALAKIRDKDMRILQESNIEARESEAINAGGSGGKRKRFHLTVYQRRTGTSQISLYSTELYLK